jgi:predicted aspartyl protease
MAQTKCGFDSSPGTSGSNLLVLYGPTLLVDIGFDPNYDPQNPDNLAVPGIRGIQALVDTGAEQSCIDSLLASQLTLPIIDKKPISGIGGQMEANIYMAQVHVPSLAFTLYGIFVGVHLQAGGQWHKALLGRDFLRAFTTVYEGKTGTVTISSD